MHKEDYIDPVPAALVESELTADRFLRDTNKGGNKIYVVDAFCAPNTMLEVGRLREIAFRTAGGGTGKSCDIDQFDTMEPPCKQLVVWDPVRRAIVGGYRYILGEDVKIENGVPRIATSHMFHFSERFLKDYLPYTIELGRSFVSLDYQSTRANAHAIFALDNLWDGLGALTIEYPQIKYMFGKFTVYPNYPTNCHDALFHFLNLYFRDTENLITPIHPVPGRESADLASEYTGNDFKHDYKVLNDYVRSRGINIPPLVNAYMSLSPTMKLFGTAVNYEFGNVDESGILVAIDEIREEKKRRHIETYKRNIEEK